MLYLNVSHVQRGYSPPLCCFVFIPFDCDNRYVFRIREGYRFTCNRHVLTRFVCTYIGMFLFFIHHHIACIASHSIARPAERLVISPKHKIACYTNCPISNSRGLITHASIDSFLSYTDDIILCFTFSTFRLKNPTAIVIS